MDNIYYIEPHISYKDHYKLNIKYEAYEEMCSAGPINVSFNTLASRLMGLDYTTFLKMIRQNYSAELHGKDKTYISYSFTDKKKANELKEELNKRWNLLLTTKSI